jgi:hypothetical protein
VEIRVIYLIVNLKPKFQDSNFKNDELHIHTFNPVFTPLGNEFTKSLNHDLNLIVIINLKTKVS